MRLFALLCVLAFFNPHDTRAEYVRRMYVSGLAARYPTWLFASKDVLWRVTGVLIAGPRIEMLTVRDDGGTYALSGFERIVALELERGGPDQPHLDYYLASRPQPESFACFGLELTRGPAHRRVELDLNAEYPGPTRLNECPEALWGWDERAGEMEIRSCARLRSVEPEHVLEMLTVVHRRGVIEAFALDVSADDAPLEVYRQGCWPWIRDPNARPTPRHHQGFELDWDDAGRLATIVSVMDGLRAGPYLVVRADGTPALFGSYEDDLPHGVWAWLGPDGSIVRAKLFVFGVDAGELPFVNVVEP